MLQTICWDKNLEYRSRLTIQFLIIDMRKVRLKNYVAGRWVLNIRTDEQDNFLRAKVKSILRGFQDIQKEHLHTDSVASRRPGFRMSCLMTVSKGWIFFTLISKQTSSRTILWCESWCCMSIDTRSRSSIIHCCKIEEICLRYEWCSPTLTVNSWRSTVQLWYDSHVSRQMLLCIIVNEFARAHWWPKEVYTVEDLGNISMNPRVQTEVDAAYEKMLNPIARSPATGKSDRNC